ncbi:MAG: hypothetical protein ABJE99_13240 [Roseobacter sp.]
MILRFALPTMRSVPLIDQAARIGVHAAIAKGCHAGLILNIIALRPKHAHHPALRVKNRQPDTLLARLRPPSASKDTIKWAASRIKR